ncbi:MAG: hypothetical protein HY290_30490 [Planctomycetia bacterium]|nr:hypothetical protein [Planctomycetia bacterium]
MNTNELYERWRESRSQIDPPAEFADRVMEAIDAPAPMAEPAPQNSKASRIVRAAVYAAAALAALFRIVEFLSLFVASRIEN